MGNGFFDLDGVQLPILSSASLRLLVWCVVLGHIFPHEFPKHLSGRLILRPAYFKELFAQIALNAYSQTYVLHSLGV